MVSLFLLFLYAFGICYFIGASVTAFLRLQFTNKLYNIGIGLVAITVLARLWAFFFGISWSFQLLLLLLTVFSVWTRKAELRTFITGKYLKANWLVLSILFIAVSFFCSQQSVTYDEGLYHASFIKWLNEYGIVSGVANLHVRLGFNSNWHLFASVFNFDFLFGQPLNQLNGFLALWAVALFLNERMIWADNQRIVRFAYAAVLFILFPLMAVYYFIDPSADYVVAIMALLVFYELYFYKDKKSPFSNIVFIGIIAVFLFTVKLSAFYLILAALLPLVYGRRYPRVLLYFIVAGLLITVPWLLSNYYLSGLLIYPYLNMPVLHPLWKVPEELTKQEILNIRYFPFVRLAGLSREALEHMDMLTKYKLLLLNIRALDKLLIFVTLLLYSYYFIKNLIVKNRDRFKITAVGLGLLGLLITLLSAPDFRFYAGNTYFIICVFIVELRWRIISARFAVLVCFAEIILTVFLYVRFKPKVLNPAFNRSNHLTFNPLLPEKYPVCDNTPVYINSTKFYLFNENQGQLNWDKIPSIYTFSPANISMIDTTDIRKGFFSPVATTPKR